MSIVSPTFRHERLEPRVDNVVQKQDLLLVLQICSVTTGWRSVGRVACACCATSFRVALRMPCTSQLVGLALYRWSSLVNHSCHPNASHLLLPDGRMATFALRDIRAGDEVAYSYIPHLNLLPYPLRAWRLTSHLGHQC